MIQPLPNEFKNKMKIVLNSLKAKNTTKTLTVGSFGDSDSLWCSCKVKVLWHTWEAQRCGPSESLEGRAPAARTNRHANRENLKNESL